MSLTRAEVLWPRRSEPGRGKLCEGSTSHSDMGAAIPPGSPGVCPGRVHSPIPLPQRLISQALILPLAPLTQWPETCHGSLSPQRDGLSLAPTLASWHSAPAWPGWDTPRADTHPICRAAQSPGPPTYWGRGDRNHICLKVLSLSWGHLLDLSAEPTS